ncbi:hypothetical protein [Viridibacillus arvi]|uniref:hypothetical protein n=1 Tax=Viridibacillus arvi TaxID=263475 RepID=UPI0034CD5B4C
MKDYYIGGIERLEKQAQLVVNKAFQEAFLQDYSKEVLESCNENRLKDFFRTIQNLVAIETSPLTIDQVKQILLASETGGVALQAFTNYTCKRCNTVNTWHNSAVPMLCDKCREEAALKIINSKVLLQLNINVTNRKEEII